MPCTGGTHRSRLSPNISTCLLQEAKKSKFGRTSLGETVRGTIFTLVRKKSIPCSCGVGDGDTVFFFSFCLKGGSKKPRRNAKATRTVRKGVVWGRENEPVKNCQYMYYRSKRKRFREKKICFLFGTQALSKKKHYEKDLPKQ